VHHFAVGRCHWLKNARLARLHHFARYFQGKTGECIAAALAVFWAAMLFARPFLPDLGWQVLPWPGLAAIPLLAMLIAWGAARASILVWLRRLP